MARPVIVSLSLLIATVVPGIRTASGWGMTRGPQAQPARSRVEFAAALSKVRHGMTAADVRKAVGEPDDVRTERDPGGVWPVGAGEIWRYGTNGHLAFATLGTVRIAANGKVDEVFGGTGDPAVGFDEAELRRLLVLLASVPSYNDPLDPLALIRAVNALQPLGKARALAVVDEYLRVASPFEEDRDAKGVFLVMRALFDVPGKGLMPRMSVGSADRLPPRDRRALPRWPLAIVDDIPLKLVRNYELAGKAETPAMDVAWFRAHGDLRGVPMRPPPSPLEAVDRYIEQSLTKVMDVDDDLRVYLYDQALRLVATVSRPASTVDGWFPPGPNVPERWAKVRADVGKLDPRWSATENQYVRADGSILPPLRARIWPRVWWEPAISGAEMARLTFERKSDDRVDAFLSLEVEREQALIPGLLRVRDAASGTVLAEFPVDPLTPARDSSISRSNLTPTQIHIARRLASPVGRPIRAEWSDSAGKQSQKKLQP